MNDDQVLIGGSEHFFSHFCQYFKFDVCHQGADMRIRQATNLFEDP